ncbi:MAG: 50S ribosomal protein L24 [Chloroflexota bacterium]
MRLKQGDTVIVIAGNDKGTQGEITQVLARQNRIVVSGVNRRTKHQKPRQAGRSQVQGGIVEFEAPIDVSNVMLVCPHTGEPTRVGIRRDEDGKPVRFSKKSGKDL